jgi:hypothetical protein
MHSNCRETPLNQRDRARYVLAPCARHSFPIAPCAIRKNWLTQKWNDDQMVAWRDSRNETERAESAACIIRDSLAISIGTRRIWQFAFPKAINKLKTRETSLPSTNRILRWRNRHPSTKKAAHLENTVSPIRFQVIKSAQSRAVLNSLLNLHLNFKLCYFYIILHKKWRVFPFASRT